MALSHTLPHITYPELHHLDLYLTKLQEHENLDPEDFNACDMIKQVVDVLISERQSAKSNENTKNQQLHSTHRNKTLRNRFRTWIIKT